MTASYTLTFAAIATVIIAVPGPSVLFTISRALTVGRTCALFTVAGNELGGCAQVIAVAFGVGALLQRSAAVFLMVNGPAPGTWSTWASRRSGTGGRWPTRWPHGSHRCGRCGLSGTGSWSA